MCKNCYINIWLIINRLTTMSILLYQDIWYSSYEPSSRILPSLAKTTPSYLVLGLVYRPDRRGQQFSHLLTTRGAYDRHGLPAKVHAIEELLPSNRGVRWLSKGKWYNLQTGKTLIEICRIVHTGILQQQWKLENCKFSCYCLTWTHIFLKSRITTALRSVTNWLS